MFEEYGLEVPTTRDEFFKVCDTFMEAGVYPMVHPYNFIHGVYHEMDAFLPPWQRQQEMSRYG